MQIDIKLKQNSYKVFINELEKLNFDTKVVLLSNARILNLHLKTLKNKIKCKELFIISIEEGEEYKNLQTVEKILNQMFAHHIDRKSILISFGGGVISDIGGFVASIYQRGISFINIPTTLLACVDASVGGKTGVNNQFGKNLIGSFYQPKAVYCQSEFLKTLNDKELSSAMAEVIKMALSFDIRFFKFIQNIDKKLFLSRDDELLSNIIQKSVEIKAKIVSKDEKENHLRMILNYGHTFAHVIENQTFYKKYLHAEAVSIGIHMANILAYHLNLLQKTQIQEINQTLQKFDLPIFYKIPNINAFYQNFFLDKKTKQEKINFILLKKIGKAIIKDDIDKNTILKSLESFT
ncbi:3-dehydroquinate synthase [Campylobacter novaezeelandiae]|uniref:3-dehydroquinate synthase n=1 Tax=Campylobacter novaezeelandiae TaxID=2267891 RepID=A0A4Q9JVR3_9BACT|nr:3-dehydroquinate synthase [Campylobacter novaezeelandiae]TBR81545.1 3-dehydroquinate synthase [Campylobacter novaezeelandiae]TBR82288.1 3-dehydroquinate synthase [Campylobacter novaezeelandiae]